MPAPLKFPARLVLTLALAGGALAGAGFASAAGRRPDRPADAERAIRGVLDAQTAAWNRGDVDAFMEGYDKSPATRFASGGTITRGWATVRDRYKARYPTREQMGTLTFTDLEISAAAGSTAVVFGRWRLEFENGKGAGGLFTLVFERRPVGWRIVADHTSSE